VHPEPVVLAQVYNSSGWRTNRELEPVVGHLRSPDLADYTVFLVNRPDGMCECRYAASSLVPRAVRLLRPPTLLVHPPAGDRGKSQAVVVLFHNIRLSLFFLICFWYTNFTYVRLAVIDVSMLSVTWRAISNIAGSRTSLEIVQPYFHV
jgi:hypothetical protein